MNQAHFYNPFQVLPGFWDLLQTLEYFVTEVISGIWKISANILRIKEVTRTQTYLECCCQSKGKSPRSLSRVTHESQTLKWILILLLILPLLLDNDHGEHPGVDQVLDPVADGVNGVETTVLGGTCVGGVLGQDHSSPRHGELEVGEWSSGSQTSSQTHQIINWLASVFDAPESSSRLHSQIFNKKILKLLITHTGAEERWSTWGNLLFCLRCSCLSLLSTNLISSISSTELLRWDNHD